MNNTKKPKAIIILSSLYSEIDAEYSSTIQNIFEMKSSERVARLRVTSQTRGYSISMSDVKVIDLTYFATTGIKSKENTEAPWFNCDFLRKQLKNDIDNPTNSKQSMDSITESPHPLETLRENLLLHFRLLLEYVRQESTNFGYPKLIFFVYPPFKKLTSCWSETLYHMEIALAHSQQWNFIPYTIANTPFQYIHGKVMDFTLSFIQDMRGYKFMFPNKSCSLYLKTVLQILLESCGASISFDINHSNNLYDFIMLDPDSPQRMLYQQGHSLLGENTCTNYIGISNFVSNMISNTRIPSKCLPTRSSSRIPVSLILQRSIHPNMMSFNRRIYLPDYIKHIPINLVAKSPKYSQLIINNIGLCTTFTREHVMYYGITGGYAGYIFLQNPTCYVTYLGELNNDFKIDRNPLWNQVLPLSIFMRSLDFLSPLSAIRNFESFLPHEIKNIWNIMSNDYPLDYAIIVKTLEMPRYNTLAFRETPHTNGALILPDIEKMERVLVQIFHTMKKFIGIKATKTEPYLKMDTFNEMKHEDIKAKARIYICVVSLIFRHGWNNAMKASVLYYISRQILIELIGSNLFTIDEIIKEIGLYFSPIVVMMMLTNEFFGERESLPQDIVSILDVYQIPISIWSLDQRKMISKCIYRTVLKDVLPYTQIQNFENATPSIQVSGICNLILDNIYHLLYDENTENLPYHEHIDAREFIYPTNFNLSSRDRKRFPDSPQSRRNDISFWVWILTNLVIFIEPYAKNEFFTVSGTIISSILEFMKHVRKEAFTETLLATLTFLVQQVAKFRKNDSHLEEPTHTIPSLYVASTNESQHIEIDEREFGTVEDLPNLNNSIDFEDLFSLSHSVLFPMALEDSQPIFPPDLSSLIYKRKEPDTPDIENEGGKRIKYD